MVAVVVFVAVRLVPRVIVIAIDTDCRLTPPQMMWTVEDDQEHTTPP